MQFSVEVTFVEAFIEASVGKTFVKAFMEASVEVAAVEASVDVNSLEASTKNFRGGNFNERKLRHGSVKASRDISMLPWKL